MIRLPDPRQVSPLLDRDFPLGDGLADTRTEAVCPYCGENVDIAVDPGSGPVQEYVEDCPVCCHPWMVRVVYESNGRARVTLGTEDESERG